ncbi:MAG: 30S ribosomal protein S3 [Lagierella massiliensis]|nr:30S ribosomal protein S3 [Lagierella massiliensis]
MGQKVNPHGIRVGVIKDWSSKWFADKKDFADLLVEDKKIREMVKEEVYLSGVSEIHIERASNKIKVTINTAKPGMVIGRQGAGVEVLRNKLEKLTDKQVIINVEEVKRPDLDAQLVAENIAASLERRVSFRRAMKQAIQRSMRAGAKGVKTSVSGRVGGADMARTEGYSEGTIPLQTLRADISYGFAEADTTYGKLGVKVWIYKGEVLPGMKEAELPEIKDNKRRNKRNRRNNPKRNNRGQSENN